MMELMHTFVVVIVLGALLLIYFGTGYVVGSILQAKRRKQTLSARVEGVRKARGL